MQGRWRGIIVPISCCLSILAVIVASILLAPAPRPNTDVTQLFSNADQQGSSFSRLGPYEGMLAPETTIVMIDGENLELQNLRGKYVILWFMATWCPSCWVVGPLIRETVVGRGDVEVIVVDVWTEAVLRRAGLWGRKDIPAPEDEEALKSFAANAGSESWLLAIDKDGTLAGQWNVTYVDTLFVIDPRGRIVLRSDGPVTPSVLQNALSSSRIQSETTSSPTRRLGCC